jgi:predicted dehydrogenase
MEAFHYRFHTMFLRALDIVREGRLGRLIRAEGLFEAAITRGPGQLRWDPAQGGGGAMDLGCYVIHALRTLIGAEPSLVRADAVLEGGIDAAMSADLAFPGEVMAKVSSSMTGERTDWIVLEGEYATLRLNRFVSPQQGGFLTLTSPRGEHRETADGPSSYEAQLAHVVEVMRGDIPPVTGGEDAVANMTVIDAMRRAVGMSVG